MFGEVRGNRSYTPWLDALEHLVRAPDGDELLKVMDGSAPLWRAWIARDRPMPSARPDVAHILEQTLKRQMASFLREAGKRRPLVVFLDDLHWADPSTIDVLGYLVDRRDEIRVFLLASHRPEYCASPSDPLPELLREQCVKHACCEIALEGLHPGDVQRYLDLSFPGHTFPGEFVTLVSQQTEGNPLFLADLVDHFLEEGVIFRDKPSDRWSVAEPISEIKAYIPSSVHALIGSRMQRLDQECHRLLSIASIQGCEFDSAVLACVTGRTRPAIEDRLASAETLGLFRHVLDLDLPDGSATRRYRFTHVLYQNALHEMLSPGHLSDWSACVADALLTLHQGETDPIAAAIARLFETAGDAARAAVHFAIAARRSLGVSASRETVASAERGLRLVSSVPAGVTRDRLELELLIPLGSALSRLRGYAAPRVGQAYQRIYDLCNGSENDGDLQVALRGLTGYSLARAELTVAKKPPDASWPPPSDPETGAFSSGLASPGGSR
jgi:AAA ATPase domain